MSAEQLTSQSASEISLGDKFKSSFDGLKKLPLSFWRNLVIVIACIWMVRSFASLFWLVFPTPDVPQPSKLAPPINIASSSETKSVPFKQLAYLQGVYGEANAVVAPVETQTESVPDDTKTTKLNLKLHGVIASNDPTKGSAIIADGREQALYSVGDEIKGTGGVKLAKVLEKRVIIDNRGTFESLWLYSEEDFDAKSTARMQPTPMPSNFRSRTMPPSAQTVRTSARPEQLASKSVGDVVRFSVHREGGKMIGYRIRPGRDRELFNQVGLKPNDIVTSVNGIEVNDPKQIRSVYKSMKTATEAQLTVLRDGATHSITISLDTGE